MRLKTMNKKINQTKLEMSMVLGEFKIKLDTYLRKNVDFTSYCEVECSSVCITTDDFLTDDEVKDIEDTFLLELSSYQQTFTKGEHLVSVLYIFHHKKMP